MAFTIRTLTEVDRPLANCFEIRQFNTIILTI